MALVLGLGSVAAVAQTSAPEQVVRDTTGRLMERLEAAGPQVEHDSRLLYEIVDTTVMPVVDLDASARLALGKHWKSASAEQQARFREDFRLLLLRAYATSLLEGRGRQIEYLPFRGQPKDCYVTVDTRLAPGRGQSALALSYCLRLSGEQWRLYDVRVEGVSLMTSLGVTFDKEIERVGLEAFLDDLRRRVREAPGP